jgi:hypothetical protein
LFGHFKNTEQLFDDVDRKYRDFWINSIVDFVKSGSPKSAKHPEWTLATGKNSGDVLRVQNDKPTLEHGLQEKELSFWTELHKRCGFNICRQLPLK